MRARWRCGLVSHSFDHLLRLDKPEFVLSFSVLSDLALDACLRRSASRRADQRDVDIAGVRRRVLVHAPHRRHFAVDRRRLETDTGSLDAGRLLDVDLTVSVQLRTTFEVVAGATRSC